MDTEDRKKAALAAFDRVENDVLLFLNKDWKPLLDLIRAELLQPAAQGNDIDKIEERVKNAGYKGYCSVSLSAIEFETLIRAAKNNSEGELVEICEGLAFGTDWNEGTHAKIYRPKLLEWLATHKQAKGDKT